MRIKLEKLPLLPAFTTASALAVYLLTLAPDLTWAHFSADGPELITAAVTLGVPHPPGYPTYVLLGHLFSLLPVGTVAFRFNLFSAVCIALAAGLVTASAGYWQSGKLTERRRWWPLAVGLTFAWMPLVWGQALVTEVYGLNLLLLSALLWALIKRQSPWLVGLLLGLSVTTHLTSLFMLPVTLYLLRYPLSSDGLAVRPAEHIWVSLFGGFFLGLTPFLLLPVFASGDSPVVWGNPDHWEGWWWVVSGQIYRANVLGLPRSLWLPRLLDWSRQLVSQLAWLGVPLLLVGLGESWHRRGRTHLVFLGTALLYLVYAFFYNTYDAIVFLLPALLLVSILLAESMARIGKVAFLLPLALLMLHFTRLDLQREGQVRLLAESALEGAPPQAILITAGDRNSFPLWYLHYVEGYRPDLTLLDSHLFNFDWYRERYYRLHPSLVHPGGSDLDSFEQAQTRPLCQVTLEGATLPVTNSCREE